MAKISLKKPFSDDEEGWFVLFGAEEERLRRENERLRKEAAEARKAAHAEKEDTREPEEILGLKPGYTKAELKKAYMQKVREWHPDQLKGKAQELKDMAEEEMKKITDAYDQLSCDQ